MAPNSKWDMGKRNWNLPLEARSESYIPDVLLVLLREPSAQQKEKQGESSAPILCSLRVLNASSLTVSIGEGVWGLSPPSAVGAALTAWSPGGPTTCWPAGSCPAQRPPSSGTTLSSHHGHRHSLFLLFLSLRIFFVFVLQSNEGKGSQ